MKLNKNLNIISFALIVTCISSITIASRNAVFYNSHCITPEHKFIQSVTKAGKNSFTASQIKNYLMKNGFTNIKRLHLDDKGIWRALVKFKKCHFFISVDYSGAINIQNTKQNYD
ncbi:hypothetical protein [Bartonella sp. F02]|uniref:hypothetical protein n=1 Tax=Bartonella sp. F02 TaxID=2967262 RepID=UPI0022A995CC|nr:hypothetical protein [Bartonella sp. F02]MCZ2328256.1 hypothetical protein [Bartonella sp. F02]